MYKKIKYSLIIPVYNEEDSLDELYNRIFDVSKNFNGEYEIIFVNDGSQDKSIEVLKRLYANDKRIIIINLSRNFGHQVAITAGMDFASGEAVITMDSDLQDPPEVIPRLIEKWQEGFEVVYGVRDERKGESIFKKITAKIFYRILNKMSNIKIPLDTGDFRLMDKKVVDVLKEIREENRYMRGLTSWVGFSQIGIVYKRDARFAGRTKYPLGKMIKLALDAFVSFSGLPLKMATYIGFLISFLSFIYLFYILWLKIFTAELIQGWSSLITAVLFIGGIQLICLGIIGEYIGRINNEVKRRPLYVVRNIISKNSK